MFKKVDCSFALLVVTWVSGPLTLTGQPKAEIAPQEVISRFIEKTGAARWSHWGTRKEYAWVEYEDERDAIVPSRSYDRIRVDLSPGSSLELHTAQGSLRSVLVYKPNCNWYYSNASQVVKFFGPEPITFDTSYPRTELMEVLNLKTFPTVYQADTLYRVDFNDLRQRDGKQSLFFGIRSGLLYKRSFLSKTEVLWEYHYRNYQETHGFFEPRRIRLTSSGEGFFTITIKSVQYQVDVDTALFIPPVPCKNTDDFQRLNFPYAISLD